MKNGNMNAEMMYLRAGLNAPLTECEKARQAARDASDIESQQGALPAAVAGLPLETASPSPAALSAQSLPTVTERTDALGEGLGSVRTAPA
jgi:hypothetical protein